MDPAQAQAILAASAEAGVTFFDTADVYGDGRSEQAIGAFLADNPGLDITVATKMGRRVEQRPENYNLANFREWVDRSRRNLRTEALDLVQLHCPPTAVYSQAEVYDALDTLVAEGPSGTTASAWNGPTKPSKPCGTRAPRPCRSS